MASESLSATCDSLTAHVAAMGDLLEENRRAVQAAKKHEQRSNTITNSGATQYVKAVDLTVFALTDFLDPAPAARYLGHTSKANPAQDVALFEK